MEPAPPNLPGYRDGEQAEADEPGEEPEGGAAAAAGPFADERGWKVEEPASTPRRTSAPPRFVPPSRRYRTAGSEGALRDAGCSARALAVHHSKSGSQFPTKRVKFLLLMLRQREKPNREGSEVSKGEA